MRSKALEEVSTDLAPPAAAPHKGPLQIAWRRRWWIVLTTVAALGAAVLYLNRVTPIYVSNARIYIQQFSPVGKSQGENLGARSEGTVSTQAELIASEPLLRGVAELPEVRQMKMMAGVDNPIPVIRAGLIVTTDRDFINVSYESPHNVEAAQLVNLIVQQYEEFNGKQRSNNAYEILKILQAEKDKREKDLEARVKEVLEFRRKNGMLSLTDGDKGNIILQKLAKLSEALTTSQLDQMEAEATFNAVEKLRNEAPERLMELARFETPREMKLELDQNASQQESTDLRLLSMSDSLRERIEEAERSLARLRRTRTPEHKDVIDAEADLVVLQEQLAKNELMIAGQKEKLLEQQRRAALESQSQQAVADRSKQETRDKQMVEAYIASVTRRYEQARQRSMQLATNFEAQKVEALGLNTLATEFAALEGDRQRAEKLVQMLEDKIKDINVTEDTNVVKVTTLEVAKPGESPIRPDRKRVIGVALLLGLMLGFGLVLGLDAMDQRLRSVEEIMSVIDVPVFGLIPHIEQSEAQTTRGRKVQLEPTSDVAEAYRTVRTAVYFADRETHATKLLVTSPAPGDGKSTTASNLAIAMAQAGRRVLIIDADCRRPTQHKIFGFDGTIGLTSVMAGLESVDSAIQKTDIDTLDVMPCGPLPANPAEILNGQGFAELLNHLQQSYDHIVIDSPPVAPVTDALILSALADETILVLRANKATKRLTMHAREGLASVGARIIGIIINDVPRRRDRYGYYYGYSYGYGYGYGYYGYGYGRERTKVAGAIPVTGNGNGHPALVEEPSTTGPRV